MNGKVGTLDGKLVWLFALAAVALGIAATYATAGLGAKVSSAVYFGVFAVAGFLATLLTQARTGIAVLAFLVGSVMSAGAYFYVASSTVASAAGSVAAAGGGDAAVGSALGAFVGAFVAIVTLVVSLVGGIGGCVAGARAKRTVLAAQ